MRAHLAACILLLSAASALAADPADDHKKPEAGHITGIGGLFFKAKDPKALAAWYHDVLGLEVADWGGAMLRYDAPGHPSVIVWNAFRPDAKYFAPSTREFMINFAVDDLDATVARLEAKGVKILGREGDDANGRFAWILDPEGTKIELWQDPKARK